MDQKVLGGAGEVESQPFIMERTLRRDITQTLDKYAK